MHKNQEKHEKKPAADEVKEKNKIHNVECNDSVMLSNENGERIINDKDEMHGNGVNGKGREVDTTGKHDEDKGNILKR